MILPLAALTVFNRRIRVVREKYCQTSHNKVTGATFLIKVLFPKPPALFCFYVSLDSSPCSRLLTACSFVYLVKVKTKNWVELHLPIVVVHFFALSLSLSLCYNFVTFMRERSKMSWIMYRVVGAICGSKFFNRYPFYSYIHSHTQSKFYSLCGHQVFLSIFSEWM